MSDEFIGRQLGNFRVERLLGRGGMAQVYYGWDVALDRPVAIKVIDARYRDNPSYAERFVREARTIARWRHDNIVQIYHASSEEGLYYFAMEYVNGQDLSAVLRHYAEQGHLMPQREVLRIGQAIAAALDYAHSQGVIHRDVKPANVLLARDGRVLLGDFGLALDVAQGTLGQVFGTAHYIAPEQAADSAGVVPQSDLYALGVMLYEMLAGQVPFDDPSPGSLAAQHMTLQPPSPRHFNPELPAETEAVVLQALNKQPEERFPTGQALIRALANSLAAPRAQAERTQTGLVFGGLAIVGLLVVAIIAVALARRGDAQPDLQPGQTSEPVAVAEASATLPPTTTPPPPQPTFTPEAIVEATTLPQPTAEPVLPTNTPEPPPVVDTAPTVLFPDGYRLVMIYSQRSFYLWNPGDRRLAVSRFTFEALDDTSGSPVDYRYTGDFWAAYYPDVLSNHCVALEIAQLQAPQRPSQCNIYNAIRSPVETSPWIFWHARSGVSTFRVLWDGQEVGRCEISAGVCETHIP